MLVYGKNLPNQSTVAATTTTTTVNDVIQETKIDQT